MIGLSFGLQIGRTRSRKGLAWSIVLAAVFLLTFIAAKSLKGSPALAVMLYLIPHPLILLLCLRSFKRINQGVET
jgi:lipopolysaccharide export LptBFGC system permease protein LptF